MPGGAVKGSHWFSSIELADKLFLSPKELVIAKQYYNSQMKSSIKRNIIWSFTFETWVRWWHKQLGNDWLYKRGKLKHQYCMARIGDKGPYNPKNVKCITSSNNASERKTNGTAANGNAIARPGERNGNAKLTEAKVIEIFKATGPYTQIASNYSVCLTRVYSIKKKQTWKYLTEGLD